ncbi:MAG: DUF4097 family beta strand repeat protein [Bryobacterales bacterium]|nr:DUF4097 family beta strand repeat protein [Bryobacterales bacterium]
MHRRALLLACVAGATALVGCDYEGWGSSDRFKEDFSQTYDLKPGGSLFLESLNGSVDVMGWDQDTVDIKGTKYAATEDLLKQLKIDIAADGNSVRIRAIRPSERGNCGARFAIRVPRKIVLDRIETSNGPVRVENITGNVRARTSNGGIRVWAVTGDLDANTSNATVEVGQFSGAAVLRTSNGRIKADGVKGSFEGKTSNGSIDVSLSDIDSARPVRLQTSNASINLTMENFKNNEIRAEASNGSINVRLPADVNAQVRASTSNGGINTDFETKTTTVSKHRLEGSIGSGGALIDLNTSNGAIRLMKR